MLKYIFFLTLVSVVQINPSPVKSEDTNEIRKKIIDIAHKYKGSEYRYGGTGSNGFDCSGFVRHVYSLVGISLPRTSGAQFAKGKKIEIKNAKPGDLVFYNIDGNGISHVGIYIEKNSFIHAPRQGKKVSIADMNISYWKKRFVGAVTYLDN